MKHRLLITFFLLVSFVDSYSQSFYTTEFLDYLEPNHISSGYLLDKGFDYVNFSNFDGTTLTDSNNATLFTFRNYLLTLNAARTSEANPWYNANSIVSDMISASGVRINIAFFKHEYILPNAVSDHLISQQNGLFLDYYEQGVWVNPYGLSYSLVFAPGKLVHDGLCVTYNLGNNGQVYTNAAALISLIEFDAGDGNGYVNIGSAFPYTVTYSQDGMKELKVRMTLTDGRILQSHASILINDPPVNPINNDFDGIIPFSIYSSYSNSAVSATVTYRYASGNSGSVRKPFIFVEGFDDRVIGAFSESTSPFQFLGAITKNNTRNALSYFDYAGSSLFTNYDFFYVDWDNPRADIRANAELLEAIIAYINDMKPADGTADRNIVMGHSMGGLIARYALCDMENQGIDHETDYYVSHDAPHLGANVPLGLQYAIRHLYPFIYGDSQNQGLIDTSHFKNRIDNVVGALDSPSARQMMYNYVSTAAELDNTMHNDWLGVLSQIGFPKGYPFLPIENVAIVNGGSFSGDTSSPLLGLNFHLGSQPSSAFESFLHWLGHFFINVSLHAYPNTTANHLVESDTLSFSRGFLGNTVTYTTTPHYHLSPSCLEYDYSPGSYLDDSSFSFLGINARTNFTFIPESSALAVYSGNNTHYTYSSLLPFIDTPFASFWLFNDRHGHMFDYYNGSWLPDQFNMSINGPEGIALHDDTFTLSGYDYSTVDWSTSDSSIATINDTSGKISIVDTDGFGGLIRLSCYASKNNNHHHKHKTLFAGFPRMVLNSQVVDISHTRVVASCIDTTQNVYLDSLAANGIISFAWGKTSLNNGIDWIGVTNNRSYSFVGGLGSEYFMKIINGPGRESATMHTPTSQIIDCFAYGFSPNIILVSDNSVYLYYNDIQDPGYGTSAANSYAATWIVSGYEGSTIPDNLYIDGQSLPVVATTQQSINGEAKTLYCFNILNSTKVQSGISAIRAGTAPPIGYIVRGYLRSGTTNLQQVIISMSEL